MIAVDDGTAQAVHRAVDALNDAIADAAVSGFVVRFDVKDAFGLGRVSHPVVSAEVSFLCRPAPRPASAIEPSLGRIPPR